jgi:hypothetical protein
VTGTKSEIAFLARPRRLRASPVAESLAERAVEKSRDQEAYLAAVLAEEVSARDGHVGQPSMKAARFLQTKILDDFDFSFVQSLKKTVAHLAPQASLSELQRPSLPRPSSSATAMRRPFWSTTCPLCGGHCPRKDRTKEIMQTTEDV